MSSAMNMTMSGRLGAAEAAVGSSVRTPTIRTSAKEQVERNSRKRFISFGALQAEYMAIRRFYRRPPLRFGGHLNRIAANVSQRPRRTQSPQRKKRPQDNRNSSG